MKNFPKRKSIRLTDYDYTSSGAYFITICAYERHCIFGDILNGKIRLSKLGEIIQNEWLNTQNIRPYISLDEFVIMPNHFHGIIFVADNERATQRVAPTKGIKAGSIGAIIGQFKSITTKKINQLDNKFSSNKIWQRNYFEHVIRNDKTLNECREYIVNNPLKWELDELNPDRSSPVKIGKK